MGNALKTGKAVVPILWLLCWGVVLFSCKSPPTKPKDENRNPPPDTRGLFFDDFSYAAASDPSLAAFGWTVRSGGGGPGPEGCAWDPALVTFIADTGNAGNRLMRLSARTEGTGATCHQSEVFSAIRFLRATFAARILFTDIPEMGEDGDGVVQTFFTIASWDQADQDAYSEFDFEYLPNGGWGIAGETLWETSWEKVGDSRSTRQRASHAGAWQTLAVQTDSVETRYFVNGVSAALHPEPYVADGRMSVNFNHWFISDRLKTRNTEKRMYSYCVDWVFVRTDSLISPETVEARVQALRASGISRVDGAVPRRSGM
jgi:hypothetical protein